jgi:leader peptidase (prepilin peptidase) / N-methyltransferase
MSTTALAALAGAAICVVSAPYLARLVATVPDADNRQWWLGKAADRRTLVLTAVTGAVLGVLAGAAAGWGATLPALLALALLGTPLVLIDIEVHRLPDRLVFPAAVAGAVLLAVAAAVRDDWRHYLGAAEGAAAVFAVFFALAFAVPRAFGLGDVKLGAVLGGYLGWIGWVAVYYGIFGGFVLGSVVGIALMALGRAGRKTALPFGPMLIVGTLGYLALHATTTLFR